MTTKKRLISAIFAVVMLTVASTTAQAQTKELNRLADAAAKAAKKGQTLQADSLYECYVANFREQQLPKNFQYSEILIYLSRRAAQKGQMEHAIALQKEVIEVRKSAPDCTFTQWASAMSDLASIYAQKGDYTSAIVTGQEALKMLKKKLGTKHHYYNIALANQASFYSARGQDGDYQTAVAIAEGAVNGMKKGTPEYATALNALVVYYSQVGDRISASKIAGQARKEAAKRLETDGISYATVLNNQAIRLANAHNYDDAIVFALQAKESFEKAQSTQTLAYGKLLNNLATFYSHQQNYKEAARLLETALPIIEKAVGKQHPDYLRCMSDLSAVYKGSGNLERADQLAYESNQVSRTIGAQDNAKYAKSLSKQAATFASNGNYLRAIEHEQKAFDIFRQRGDSVSMAQSLLHLASYFSYDGKLQTAFETAQSALAIFQQKGEPSPNYAQALNNTAILYYNSEQYDKARDYGRQARDMYEQIGDTTTAIFARILANNALFSYVMDSVGQALTIARQALALQTRVLGNDHPDHVPLLYNLAVYYSKLNEYAEATHNYLRAYQLQAQQVRTDFLHLTSQEREKFWNQKSYVFRYAPMLAYQNRDNESLAELAYNSQLFTKGILLNSDIDFRQLLKQSGNQTLLDKYNQLESLQHQLEDYYRQPGSSDATALNRIKEDIYQLERTLVKDCREYGSFTENLSIDAARVRQALADDEAAIEFADIYIKGRGTTYLALLLTKRHPQPRLVRLFSEDELENLKYGQLNFMEALQTRHGVNEVYRDARFGQMLWQPILRELEGVRRIYFSPTSLFYQLGIEYLPCDTLHRIGDLYAVQRLSSTKSLIARHKPGPIVTATVYGGLNYDMTLSQLREQRDHLGGEPVDEASLLAMVRPVATDMQRTLDSLTLRGSVGYLPGTLHEAENIGEQLMQHDIAADMLIGSEGTEETFKRLSGRPQSIIHIATHGFYFSENDLKWRRQRLIFLNEQGENLNNPLNYSGLLMSGANYVLTGGRVPNDLDDGILTAHEIAQLDLSKTGLVVLSACQTGLGEIREDGVFGIQRGFKKAGVHSLLMSLWSVSDEATDLMMTSFYRRLMEGLPMQQAFLLAQQSVIEGGFDDPFYWASFILLDGF